MSYDKKRNIQIDILKIISIIIIVFHHAGFFNTVLVRGYMVVDLFFIISGYFLFNSLQRGSYSSVWDFFKNRFKRYFPGYFMAWLILILALLVCDREWINYKTWYAPILEMFMLQELGIPGSSRVHYPDWYMSVLLTAGTVIYIIYKKLNRKIFNILTVMIPVIVYAYAVFFIGGMEKWERVLIFFYAPWWRGLADMLVGVCFFKLKERAEEIHISDVSPSKRYFIIFIKSVIFVFFLLSLLSCGINDFVSLLFMCLLILSAVLFPRNANDKSIVDKTASFLSLYEYEMYLCHAIVIIGVKRVAKILGLNGYEWVMAGITILGLLIYSIIFKEFIEKGFKKILDKAESIIATKKC